MNRAVRRHCGAGLSFSGRHLREKLWIDQLGRVRGTRANCLRFPYACVSQEPQQISELLCPQWRITRVGGSVLEPVQQRRFGTKAARYLGKSAFIPARACRVHKGLPLPNRAQPDERRGLFPTCFLKLLG